MSIIVVIACHAIHSVEIPELSLKRIPMLEQKNIQVIQNIKQEIQLVKVI